MLIQTPDSPQVNDLQGLTGQIIRVGSNNKGQTYFTIGNVQGQAADERFYLNAETLVAAGLNPNDFKRGARVEFNAYDPRYDPRGNLVEDKKNLKMMEARGVKVVGAANVAINTTVGTDAVVVGEVVAQSQTPVAPELDYDIHILGDNVYALTLLLHRNDEGVAGELTIQLQDGLSYQREGVDPETDQPYLTQTSANRFITESVPEDGRIELIVTNTKKARMYIAVRNFRRESTIIFDEPSYGAHMPTDADSAADHFFAGVETGRADSHAWGRLIFALIVVGSFATFLLAGTFGWKAGWVVIGIMVAYSLLYGVGGFLIDRLSIYRSHLTRFARYMGALPRLFIKTNNRLFAWLLLFAAISFWGYFIYAPSTANLATPQTRQEKRDQRVEEREQERNNRAAGLERKSDRELMEIEVTKQSEAYDSRQAVYQQQGFLSNLFTRSWWSDWVAPKSVHPNTVASIMFWVMVFLNVAMPIYFCFAIWDEVKRAWRRITRSSTQGDTEGSWLWKFFKGRFGETVVPMTAKIAVGAASGGTGAILMPILREILTGVIANRIERMVPPTMVKGRR